MNAFGNGTPVCVCVCMCVCVCVHVFESLMCVRHGVCRCYTGSIQCNAIVYGCQHVSKILACRCHMALVEMTSFNSTASQLSK